MLIAVGILLVLVCALTIWFNISYSPVKKEFENDISLLVENDRLPDVNEEFAETDFSHLPTAIQKYIEHCGYIGKSKMSYLK